MNITRKLKRQISPYTSSQQITGKSELYWEHFKAKTEEAYKAGRRLPLVLIAHDIRSLYNIGSFFRTAEGILLEKIYLTGYTAAPPRKEIAKTALGAEEMISWQKEDIKNVINLLHKEGRRIYALEHGRGSKDLMTTKLHFPAALVVGNEVESLPGEVLSLCDESVHLPMRGAKTSLNVAVAFGAAAYECLRQWATSG